MCLSQINNRMSTAKEQIAALVQQLPDDKHVREIVRELAFHVMIERRLKDSNENAPSQINQKVQLLTNHPR